MPTIGTSTRSPVSDPCGVARTPTTLPSAVAIQRPPVGALAPPTTVAVTEVVCPSAARPCGYSAPCAPRSVYPLEGVDGRVEVVVELLRGEEGGTDDVVWALIAGISPVLSLRSYSRNANPAPPTSA